MNFRSSTFSLSLYILISFFLYPAFTVCDTYHGDTTFGNNGIVITNFGVPSGTLNYVIPSIHAIVQSDGKILFVGDTHKMYMNEALRPDPTLDWSNDVVHSRMSLARYNSDGTLDTAFGDHGTRIITCDDKQSYSCAIDCALQNDGKIIIVGRTYQRSGVFPDATIIRLNSDGSFDTSFGNNGVVIDPNLPKNWSNFFKVMLQDDGKILTIGSYGTDQEEVSETLNYSLYLVRFLEDGSLDDTFGNKGKVRAFASIDNRPKQRDEERAGDGAYGATLQQDGKILVVGATLNSEEPDAGGLVGINTSSADGFIARFESDGSLDTSFGTNGFVITSASTACNFFIDVAVAPDGKIIALGSARNAQTDEVQFFMARYTHDGILDTTFGEQKNGIVLTSLGSGYAVAKNLLVQKDGKIMVTGVVQWDEYTKFTIVRYEADGILDLTFGSDSSGIMVTSVRDADDRSFALTVQDDGKLLVAGDSFNGNYFDFALVRYDVQ